MYTCIGPIYEIHESLELQVSAREPRSRFELLLLPTIASITSPTIFFITQIQLHGMAVVAKSLLHVEYYMLLHSCRHSTAVLLSRTIVESLRKFMTVMARCGRIRLALSFIKLCWFWKFKFKCESILVHDFDDCTHFFALIGLSVWIHV